METEQISHRFTLDKTLPGRAVWTSRALLYGVIGLMAFVVVWAGLTQVDVVTQARGRLIVQGEPVKISAPEPGIAIAAPVRVGDHVQAGQVVLRLDPYHYDALEANLLAGIEAARADGDVSLLGTRGETAGHSQEQIMASQAKIRSLQEQLKEVRQARQRLSLAAPVAGTITKIAATHAGVRVTPDQPAAVLVADNLPLAAEVRISNAAMRGLHENDRVRITFDAYPREDYGEATGRLVHIDPDAGDDGMYDAWITLDSPELRGPTGVERLRSGLQLNASIVIEKRSVLSLVLNPLRKLRGSMTVGE